MSWRLALWVFVLGASSCLPAFPTARFSPTSSILTTVEHGDGSTSVCTTYVDDEDRSLLDGSPNPDGAQVGGIGPDGLQLVVWFDWQADMAQFIMEDGGAGQVLADDELAISSLTEADGPVQVYSVVVGENEYDVRADASLSQSECDARTTFE